MIRLRLYYILFIFSFVFFSCGAKTQDRKSEASVLSTDNNVKPNESLSSKDIVMGDQRFDEYLPLLKGKRVALLVNQSAVVEGSHLLDTLLSKNINVIKILSPEHGFRGDADAGEVVASNVDAKTGLPIVSLYGNNKKPSAKQLDDVDVVVFDIQDVGVRFYTYISTMHYAMEACAENNKLFIVLDRPNPNGNYFDGPVLDLKYKSFVGMHPIPIVHGLTVGELAYMINGEGWLNNGDKCNLKVVDMLNYNRNMHYELPIKPSPNLASYNALRLYPSICLLEATKVSVGRGTYKPFECIGFPSNEYGDYSFTPKGIDGMSKNPKFKDQECKGYLLDYKSIDTTSISLKYIIEMYKAYPNKEEFFKSRNFFNKLAGTSSLSQQIIDGKSEEEIKATWQSDLQAYGKMREKYLIY